MVIEPLHCLIPYPLNTRPLPSRLLDGMRFMDERKVIYLDISPTILKGGRGWGAILEPNMTYLEYRGGVYWLQIPMAARIDMRRVFMYSRWRPPDE